jgi:hypothetical protein
MECRRRVGVPVFRDIGSDQGQRIVLKITEALKQEGAQAAKVLRSGDLFFDGPVIPLQFLLVNWQFVDTIL